VATEHRLPGAFGYVIEGMDLKYVTDKTLAHLGRLLFTHRILVLRGQNLEPTEYVAFGRRWGEPVLLIAKKNRLATHPEMIVQSNSCSVPPVIRNNAAHWHCDSAYEETPATVTMLLGVIAPDQGGETQFCDLVAAYEALPETMKQRIAGLEVRHCAGGGVAHGDEHLLRREDVPDEINANVVQLDPALHPLVRIHPVTGKAALYALGGTPFEIVGMDNDEALQLIAELKRHATQQPFRQDYRLMPGDLLLWDNFSVMHRASLIEYSDEIGKSRLNYRISVRGLPTFLTTQPSN
jgi:alpha-ketoglutarate-dependent taurine dioxygenase